MHLAQDAADLAVLMLTLLMNEKPTSSLEAWRAWKAFQSRHGCAVCGVLCVAGKKYNQHTCDMLLTPACFANLKHSLAKVAHTNPGVLFKVQKKGTKTAATPFSNLWFSSTFTLGSMFHESKTPIAKPLKHTSMVNFLPHPEQAALEAAPSPASTRKDLPDLVRRSALKKKKASNRTEPPAPTPAAPSATPVTPWAVTPAASLPRPSHSTTRTRDVRLQI